MHQSVVGNIVVQYCNTARGRLLQSVQLLASNGSATTDRFPGPTAPRG